MHGKRLGQGFTLIELVIVILLIGILSVAVMPRWQATGMNLNYELNRLLNDIRYAQALSILTNQRYRWVKTSTNTYQIVNSAGSAVTLPAGGTQVVLRSSFSSLTNLPNDLIVFNGQGIPFTDTGNPGTALGSTATITLVSGGTSGSMIVYPTTGFSTIQ